MHLPYLQHERTVAALYQQEQDAVVFGYRRQVAQVADQAAIHSRYYIASTQAALCRRAAFFNDGNLDSAVARGARGREARSGQSGMNIRARQKLVFGAAKFSRSRLRLVISEIPNANCIARAEQAYRVSQFGSTRDLLVVDADDNVADFEACVLSRGFRENACDESTALYLDIERFCGFLVDGLDIHTKQAAANLTEVENLPHDRAGNFGWDGKADADVAARPAEDHGVDADEFTAHVDQRTTGITRIDRCVCLDEVLESVPADVGATQRADDPGCHRM